MEYVNTYLDKNGNVQPVENPSWVINETIDIDTRQEFLDMIIGYVPQHPYIKGLYRTIANVETNLQEKTEELDKKILVLTTRFEERTANLERRFQNLLNILLRMNEPLVETKNDAIE